MLEPRFSIENFQPVMEAKNFEQKLSRRLGKSASPISRALDLRLLQKCAGEIFGFRELSDLKANPNQLTDIRDIKHADQKDEQS